MAGSLGNVIVNFSYFSQLIRTTPLGDFYYATGGLVYSFWWITMLVVCAGAVFILALRPSSRVPHSLTANRYFPLIFLALSVGAYMVSLAPITMSPFPWHTGRVVYIPFLAFAFAVGFAAEFLIRIHRNFGPAIAVLAAIAVAWGALGLRAESEAFDLQTRTNFYRSSMLNQLVGAEIKIGKTALVVGGFRYGDSGRPLFGEHFIGVTPGELKSQLRMTFTPLPPQFPLLISGAGVDHICKSGKLLSANSPADADLVHEATNVIVAIWSGMQWMIQRGNTPEQQLEGYLPGLSECTSPSS